MGEGKEADKLDERIRADKIFRITEENGVFFLSEDEEKIYNKYPEIKEKANVSNIDEYIDCYIDVNNVKAGRLEIDSSDLLEFVKESLMETEGWHERIYNAEDMEKEIGDIVNYCIGNYISLEIQLILQDIAENSSYKLDKWIIEDSVKTFIK
jgi:hypothetical protein